MLPMSLLLRIIWKILAKFLLHDHRQLLWRAGVVRRCFSLTQV